MRRLGRGIRDRQRRQRPIRSTLTVLLIIPVVSLIALWAYAASTTVGGAIAKRNSDTVNKVIGAPTQALFALAGANLLLIFIGIHNAWDVVTYIAIQLPEDPSSPSTSEDQRTAALREPS